jgi:hypothetical protein
MSDAAPATEPDAKPSRSGLLLCLVRKLIGYGRELATTIRQRTAINPDHTRDRFGTTDLALIIRSIARGLHLANALEARVLQRAAFLDKAPRPRGTRPRTTPRLTPPAEPADAPLARVPEVDPGISLPTPESIAAGYATGLDPWHATGLDPVVRRRPIGAVLADICRDFGILPSHPLWREVQRAIIQHGGSFARLLSDMLDRYCRLPPRTAPTVLPEPTLTPAGTGPP